MGGCTVVSVKTSGCLYSDYLQQFFFVSIHLCADGGLRMVKTWKGKRKKKGGERNELCGNENEAAGFV